MTGAYIGEGFAGQFAFDVEDEKGNAGFLVTPNLTPDPESGRITNWTEQTFIDRFHAGRVLPESVMPWGPFSRMTDLELKAIFRFLNSLDPVKAEMEIPVGFQVDPPTAPATK